MKNKNRKSITKPTCGTLKLRSRLFIYSINLKKEKRMKIPIATANVYQYSSNIFIEYFGLANTICRKLANVRIVVLAVFVRNQKWRKANIHKIMEKKWEMNSKAIIKIAIRWTNKKRERTIQYSYVWACANK